MKEQTESTIDFTKLEDWSKEPWKRIGLTLQQWVRPMSELSEEHRKVIFDVYNVKYNLTLKPQDFGMKFK